MKMKKKLSIGVDIGGSHISCAACDLNLKKYLPETFAENDLDNKAGAEEIIGIWSKTIAKTIALAGEENIAGIGFAMPGPFEYDKGIARFTSENDKYENIYGLNVSEAIRKSLALPAEFPVRYINDATAFALGEDWIGKARSVSRSLSITLGTGFGSAFLKNSLPVVEGDTVPDMGCVWHLPFENGIADDYFSTRGFLNRYKEQTGKQLKGVKELAQMASSNETAKALFDDFGLKLSMFLKPWFEKFGVEMLVIGGNISNAFSLFGKSMNDYLSAEQVVVKIEVSELKETAALIGSAVLVDDEFYAKVAPLLPLM